jgi:hypothetical protein
MLRSSTPAAGKRDTRLQESREVIKDELDVRFQADGQHRLAQGQSGGFPSLIEPLITSNFRPAIGLGDIPIDSLLTLLHTESTSYS